MSTYHTAKLVYGYDLGNMEDLYVKERGEYGDPRAAWLKRDGEGYVDESIDEGVIRRLYETWPDRDPSETDAYNQNHANKDNYGVWVEGHGWPTEGQESYALVAHVIEVDGGDSKLIQPGQLIDLVEEGDLDSKLDRALASLDGFTPTRPRGWHLLADR